MRVWDFFSRHETLSLPAQADQGKLWACSFPGRLAVVPRERGDQFHLQEAWRGQTGVLPVLPDPQGFTAVLCSCFKKQGKENKKSSALSSPAPVLPLLLPASALPGERPVSQPCRGTRAGLGCLKHGCFREGTAVPCRGGAAFPCKSMFFELGRGHCLGTCKASWFNQPSGCEIFDGSESARSRDTDSSGSGGAQGSSGSAQCSHTFSHCVSRRLRTLEACWAP